MTEKVLFIVNRKAGTDDKKAFELAAARYLNAARFTHQVVFTEYRGHAVTLAKAAAGEGAGIVAVVGGDGSVNEVARGLKGTSTLMAIIPRGSGNGLARYLGIPRDIRRAIGVINTGVPRTLDAGEANGQLFLSNAGVGFDTLIATLFRDNKGRGLVNYARLVVAAVRGYRAATYTLSTESGTGRYQAFFVTAANANQFGYGFKIAPQAQIDDGLLDVCIMKPLRWWQLGAVSLKALSGTLPGSRYATYLCCRSLEIRAEEPITAFQVDGDSLPADGGSIRMKITPGALRVLVPAGARAKL